MDEVAVDKMTNLSCSNCCEPFHDEFPFINDGQFGYETENAKSINMMLSMIYKLNYLGHLTSKEDGNFHEEEREFRLCPTCLPLLTDLYTLYDKFNGRRKPESSSLAKKIGLLDVIIDGHRNCSEQHKETVPQQQNGDSTSQKPHEIEILMRQDIFNHHDKSESQPENFQPRNYREYQKLVLSDKENSSSDCAKGPWIRIKRLDEITFDTLGFAPASLLGSFESPNSDLDICSSPWGQPDVDDDDTFDADHDVKLFGDPVIIETGNEVLQFETPTRGSRKSSSRKRKVSSVITKEEDEEEEEIVIRSKKSKTKVSRKKLDSKSIKKSKPKPVKKKYAKQKKPTTKKVLTEGGEMNDDDDLSDFLLDCVGIPDPFSPSSSSSLKDKNTIESDTQLDGQKNISGNKGQRKKDFGYLYSKRLEKCSAPCLYCLEDFQTLEERYAHVIESHRRHNVCKECGSMFKSKSGFDVHVPKCGQLIERMTKLRTPLICPEPNCGKHFDRQRGLRSHITYTHGARNFACEICGTAFKMKLTLRNHMKNKHQQQNDSQRVQCPECPSVLKNEEMLKIHCERKHTEEGRVRWKEYSRRGEEKRKQRRQASTVDGFVCSECDVDFQTKNRLTKHRLTMHSDLFKTNSVCDQCGKSFRGSYQLGKHLSFVHSDARPYICDICGKAYKSMDNLKSHQKISHNDEARVKYNEYTREKNRKRRLVDLALAKKAEQQQSHSDYSSEDPVLLLQPVVEFPSFMDIQQSHNNC